MAKKLKNRILNNGVEYRKNKGVYHRNDGGPAIIHANGTEVWLKNGCYYRPNNPTSIHISGKEEWHRK